MGKLLLIAFIAVPLIEIGLFIQVGGWIGLWPTLGAIVLTAVIGVALLRRQGMSTLTRAQGRIERGELPLPEMLEGIMLAVAGALLLTPGFMTDAMGFALLAPGVRQAIGRWVAARAVVVGSAAHARRAADGPGPDPRTGPGGTGPARTGPDDTIEGDYEVVGDPRPNPPHPPHPPGPPRDDSPWRGR